MAKKRLFPEGPGLNNVIRTSVVKPGQSLLQTSAKTMSINIQSEFHCFRAECGTDFIQFYFLLGSDFSFGFNGSKILCCRNENLHYRHKILTTEMVLKLCTMQETYIGMFFKFSFYKTAVSYCIAHTVKCQYNEIVWANKINLL